MPPIPMPACEGMLACLVSVATLAALRVARAVIAAPQRQIRFDRTRFKGYGGSALLSALE